MKWDLWTKIGSGIIGAAFVGLKAKETYALYQAQQITPTIDGKPLAPLSVIKGALVTDNVYQIRTDVRPGYVYAPASLDDARNLAFTVGQDGVYTHYVLQQNNSLYAEILPT